MQAAIADWCRTTAAAHAEPLTLDQVVRGTPLHAWAILAVLQLHSGSGEVLDTSGWSRQGRGEHGLLGTHGLDAELVGELVERGYLLPDPSSPAGAFEWDEAMRITACKPLQMRYRTPWSPHCGITESAARLERMLITSKWHLDELLESWYAVVGADVATYIDRLAQFRYGQGPLPDHKAREFAASIVALRPALSAGKLTSTAWSATGDAIAWDKRTPAHHESANTRVATASASIALTRLQQPVSFERRSYDREPLLHPWSKVASLYLGHILGDVDWQHVTIGAASLRVSLLCGCERFAEPGAVLEDWPSGYTSLATSSAPTLAEYRRTYLNGHRYAATLADRTAHPSKPDHARAESRCDAMEESGLDLADDRTLTWLGVITSRALICTRQLADRDEISTLEWCAMFTELNTDLTATCLLDQRCSRTSGTPEPWGAQADKQRRQVSEWLLEQLTSTIESATRSVLRASWELVDFPGPDYTPPGSRRGVVDRLAPGHWAAHADAPGHERNP